MAEFQDHYQILGIDPNAGIEDIRAAWRDRVQILHPDRHMSSSYSALRWAEEEMKKVNLAYDVLSDPDKRRGFDAERHQKHDSNKPQPTYAPWQPTAPPSRTSAESANTVPPSIKPRRRIIERIGVALASAFAGAIAGTMVGAMGAAVILGLIVDPIFGPDIPGGRLMGIGAFSGAVILAIMTAIYSWMHPEWPPQ